MTWWSLTCNIAREWRLMMAEALPEMISRVGPATKPPAAAKSTVICLAEAIRIRRERRFGMRDPGSGAEPSNVVYMSRGPQTSPARVRRLA